MAHTSTKSGTHTRAHARTHTHTVQRREPEGATHNPTTILNSQQLPQARTDSASINPAAGQLAIVTVRTPGYWGQGSGQEALNHYINQPASRGSEHECIFQQSVGDEVVEPHNLSISKIVLGVTHTYTHTHTHTHTPARVSGMHGAGMWGAVGHTSIKCVSCCLMAGFQGTGAMVC